MGSSFIDSLVKAISSVTRGLVNVVPAVSKSLGKALGGLGKGLSAKGLGGDLGRGLFRILGQFVSVSRGIINALGEFTNLSDSGKDTGGGACENLCRNITKTINQCISSNLSKTANSVPGNVDNKSVNKDTSTSTTKDSGDKTGKGFIGNLGKVLLGVLGKVFSFSTSKTSNQVSSENLNVLGKVWGRFFSGRPSVSQDKGSGEVTGGDSGKKSGVNLIGIIGKSLSKVISNVYSSILGKGGKDTSETPDKGVESVGKTLSKSFSSILSGVTNNTFTRGFSKIFSKLFSGNLEKVSSKTADSNSSEITSKSFLGTIGKSLSETISKVYSSILGKSTKSVSNENYSSTEGKQSSSNYSRSYIGVLFKGISKTLGSLFTKITGYSGKTTSDIDTSKSKQTESPVPPKDTNTRVFDGIKKALVSLGRVAKPLQPIVRGLIGVFRIAGKTLLAFTRVGLSIIALGALLASSFISILSSTKSLVSGLASLPSSIVNASQKISSIGSTILDTFTGIPNQLQSAFGGVISMIKSYSPAEAKQIEIAFGRLRATIGQILAPIAPMISNIVLNVARIIKDGASQIDIKGLFKWVVFFMSITVGTVIAGVKLLVGIIRKLRGGLQGGFRGILSVIASLLGKAVQIVVKLLGWLLRQLPSWLSMLPRYLVQFISWLLTNLPDWLKALGGYLIELLGDIIIGLGKAIVEYFPNILYDLLDLLKSLLVFVKKAFWNFVYGIPEMFSKLGTMIWDALKSVLPGWIRRRLGIEDSSGQDQAQTQLSTPEGIMKGAEGFFKGIGLDEVGSVFGDMSKMFSGMFQKPEDEDLPFEAKEATTGTIEDLGKKAREAALGVSGDPQKVTAESSKQTSDNTKAIRDSMQLLVTNNASEDIARIAREAEVSNKSIQVLNKTSEERVDIDKREKMKLEMSINEMIYQQQRTNRILMRMAYGQKEIVEMERSKNFGYNRGAKNA